MLNRDQIEAMHDAVCRDVVSNRIGVAPRLLRHLRRLNNLKVQRGQEPISETDATPRYAAI
jgi:hypothetical protein